MGSEMCIRDRKDLVSGLNVLIVPPNLTLSSITLYAVPPLIFVMLINALSTGSVDLLTIV